MVEPTRTITGVLQIRGQTKSVILRKVDREYGSNPLVTVEVVSSREDGIDAIPYMTSAVECLRNFISEKSSSIKEVIFNKPATIVKWNDGTKTVVKCQPGDEYSRETGLAMCIAKKYLGNKGNFNEVFKKFIEDYDSPLRNGIPMVGTRIKILDAGDGAWGANGAIGRVTTERHTDGLLSSNPGYNVKIEQPANVWRISEDAKIKILS